MTRLEEKLDRVLEQIGELRSDIFQARDPVAARAAFEAETSKKKAK